VTENEVLARQPALGLLMVAVPMMIPRVRAMGFDERAELGRQVSQHIAEHGDALMFKSKPGASAKSFEMLAAGLAIGALQPGGVTFAGLHFCDDHAACEQAERGPQEWWAYTDPPELDYAFYGHDHGPDEPDPTPPAPVLVTATTPEGDPVL